MFIDGKLNDWGFFICYLKYKTHNIVLGNN